jgi:hypothetical protein
MLAVNLPPKLNSTVIVWTASSIGRLPENIMQELARASGTKPMRNLFIRATTNALLFMDLRHLEPPVMIESKSLTFVRPQANR